MGDTPVPIPNTTVKTQSADGTALGNNPRHHHFGIVILKSEASRPLEVPVTALLLKTFCHTTASVHCGMI